MEKFIRKPDISMYAGITVKKDTVLEFKNEILAQEVRRLVYKKTHPIRELLLARAMASSLVSEEDPVKQVRAEEDSISDEELATIMKDWYKQDGN